MCTADGLLKKKRLIVYKSYRLQEMSIKKMCITMKRLRSMQGAAAPGNFVNTRYTNTYSDFHHKMACIYFLSKVTPCILLFVCSVPVAYRYKKVQYCKTFQQDRKVNRSVRTPTDAQTNTHIHIKTKYLVTSYISERLRYWEKSASLMLCIEINHSF